MKGLIQAVAALASKNIVHRDIKAENLIFDNLFCIKVADFGIFLFRILRLFKNNKRKNKLRAT